MNERIKALRKGLKLTQQEFADKIGVQRNTVAMYEMGRTVPSNAVILSIVNADWGGKRVNEAWLRNGAGEMFLEQSLDDQIAQFIGHLQNDPDDTFRKKFISVLANLTEEEWAFLAEKIQEIAKEKD